MPTKTMVGAERRRLSLTDAGLTVRADDDGGGARFAGYASVFNSRTAIGNPLRWGFYEEIAPGAFSKTLSEGDARMLIDHDSYYVVSRSSAGTLSLSEDERGLAVDSALDTELSYVRDLKANLRNGNVTGMSFGFYVIKDEWNSETIEVEGADPVDVDVRVIREVRLIEVSAVTFPAYPETEAELKAVARALDHRGDPAAVEARARFRPELLDLVHIDREPGEPTRAQADPAEPAVSTQRPGLPISMRMNALAARYGLPR
ncbi:HK97 family phage prohead protease [Streptomyces sp. NPDC058052]|uniref:HK97 family phage prohead protease n=1 Tax=Streptomyces sp. NPDC058052 TaxID=3346316 RepID=UPI0036E1AB9D